MSWYEKARERVMREGLSLTLLRDGELSEDHYRAVAEGAPAAKPTPRVEAKKRRKR